MAASPDSTPAVGTEQDGLRAQQTLFEIVRRSSLRRPGQRTRNEYVLSEAEFNAFLARHLGRVAGLPLTNLSAGFAGGGIVELRGQLDPEEVLAGSAFGGYLPDSWRTSGLIVTLRGPLRLETETARGRAKALRFDVDEAYVGRQRVPVVAVEQLLAASERFGRWSVPDSVSAVIIEKNRAVVRIDS